MVTVCWTGSDLEGLIKAMRFIELSAFNMFALTNLAICVNLALIVSVSAVKAQPTTIPGRPKLLCLMRTNLERCTQQNRTCEFSERVVAQLKTIKKTSRCRLCFAGEGSQIDGRLLADYLSYIYYSYYGLFCF